MRRKHTSRGVRYTPGYRWDELEFEDDAKAIATEIAEWTRTAKAKAAEQGRLIAEDFERERQALLAECLRKRAEDLLAIAAIELEEKMQAELEADRLESQRVYREYVEKVQARFKADVENTAKWTNEITARVKKIERDMERSRLHDERIKLLERGAVKGMRRGGGLVNSWIRS
jgi:hypothetical protein